MNHQWDAEQRVIQMEAVADWFESDNPLLRQIANETLDAHYEPAIKSLLAHMKEQTGPAFKYEAITNELIALLVLSGRGRISPSAREWVAALFDIPVVQTPGAQM